MKKTIFKNTIVLSILAGLVLQGNIVSAQTFNGQPLQGHLSYIPSGTLLDTGLTAAIDSEMTKPGDSFSVKLYSPLYVSGELVFPANTIFEGLVTQAEHSGITGKNGKISLKLTAATTPDGLKYPLSAKLSTSQEDNIAQDKNGNIKGRSTKATVGTGVARAAVWTGAGTLAGLAFAPIVGGAVGLGAIAGVATGGAVGIGSNIWRKGKDVKIPSGTKLQFTLDQPMSMPASLATSTSTTTK